MKTTTNYRLRKPDLTDNYEVDDQNFNSDLLDEKLKEIEENSDNANTLINSHASSKANPHEVTASQIGLGNVPNVATNDQTPTYTVATGNAALSSGETLSVAFGKIAKAIVSLISHLADTVSHVTSAERTSWNTASTNSHTHSNKSVLDATTASYTTAEQTKLSGIATGANNYTHPNSGVTAGTYQSVTVNAAGHVTGGSNPTLPVAQGGTGATTAKAALTNLGTVAVVVSTTAPSDTTAVWIVPN